ncbi:MAG: response regulator [Verrucomicrobiota bacterium]
MKILHLEDNARDAALVRDLLSVDWPDCVIEVIATRDDFLAALAEGGYDLIISDYQLPGFNGLEALQLVRERAPEVPFVFFSGTLGEERAIEAVRAGAADYVVKDRMQRLPVAVQRVLRENREQLALRRAEEALAHEQYLLRMLMENMPDHVYFKDAQSRYISASRSLARRHGLEPAGLKGKTDFELFAKEHAQQVFADEQRIMLTGEPVVDKEEKETWRDGTVTWVSSTKLPLRDASGRIIGTFGVSRDITEKKKLEEQFLRAQRLESLGMLAAGIAHDLNNILAPVLMGAPLLRTRASHPSDLRVLNTIEASAGRGAALVRQILSFAHGAGGDQVLIQPKHLLRDITGLIEQTFPKNIVLEERIPNDLWTVLGNPTQLHQVLLNLCVNARDALAPRGGTLRLAAANHRLDAAAARAEGVGTKPGSYVVFEVSDTGTGIPPEMIERIWDPFFTTKGEGKGTGLGLATVRGIVVNHEGFVQVESRVGEGTTFRVFLPASEQAAAGPAVVTAPSFEVRGQGELVLVVDDEESIRDLASAALSRFGYRVLAAANGNEAMALYMPRAAEIALVITDLAMPEMDGHELAQALARLNPGVKILFMSGATIGEEQTLPPGAQILMKPFAVDSLTAAVHGALVGRIAS